MKFCYNTSLLFLNNPKDLDPSYKMDLDFGDCFGRKKRHLITQRNMVVRTRDLYEPPSHAVAGVLALDKRFLFVWIVCV